MKFETWFSKINGEGMMMATVSFLVKANGKVCQVKEVKVHFRCNLHTRSLIMTFRTWEDPNI